MRVVAVRHLVFPTLIGGLSGGFAAAPALAQALSGSVLGASNINPSYYFTSQDAVNEATNQLVGFGSSTVKLEMGIQDLNTTWSDGSIIYPGQTKAPPPSKYAWNTPTWPASSTLTLVNLAQTTYFSNAFSNPNIKNYVITAYSPNVPSTGSDGTEFWLNGMTATEKQQETASFYNFTKYLMQTYAGTGKSFYLEQWEGDWALKDPGRDTQPSPTAVQGMIDWLNARMAGINEARHDFAATSNVKVYGTVEVNRVQDAYNGDIYQDATGVHTGWATVTNDVLPFTNVDFASYSSYDTQQQTATTFNSSTGRYTISYADAVNYIAQHLPLSAANGQNTHSVYVGEFGLAEDSAGITAVNNMMNNVLNTVKNDGMPMALYWELYSNELKSDSGLPAGNTGDNSNTKGFYFVKPDGTPAIAYHQYRYLLSTNDPTQSSSAAIERNNLHLAYASGFSKTGATLTGPWSTSTSNANMTVGISGNQVQMTTGSDASTTPYGLATLNIDSAIGRGLKVGEYIQFTLNRQNNSGIIGVSLFGQNHGSGIAAGNQPLNVFSKGAWTWVSFNPTGTTSSPSLSYNWNSATTLGFKLLSADGNFANVAYYINGSYSGSWLYQTTATALDNFSLFAQSNTAAAGFGFNNVAVYTTDGALAAKNYTWDPSHNHTSGGSGTWDAATTANFYNGTADTTWNNATLGDNVTFDGTSAGTVTVSGAVTASTLKFNIGGYTLTGGTITMLGNQTINAAAGTATINSAIAGTNGLTVTGAGNVVLGGTNTFNGGLFVNGGGNASWSTDANLGASGQPITLDNGTLTYTGTTAPTITRPITIGAGGGTINNTGSAGTGKFIINGTDLLSGSGNLTKNGPGWLTLYGSNSGVFTGNWTINGGVIEAGASTVLGTGSVTVNPGGELANNASATTSIANPVTLAGGTLSADSGSTITNTFSGPITVNATSNVRLGNFWNGVAQNINLTGNLTGTGKLTITTASGQTTTTGKLTLTGNNAAFAGGFAIPTGTVAAGLSQSNTLGTGAITLSGGKLSLQGQQSPTGTPAAVAAVAVTGFNKDVIYGNPDTSTFATNTAGADNVFGYYQTGYTPQYNPNTTIQSAGVPLATNGIPSPNITSALAGATPFAFQPFMSNNALAINKGSTGTLALTTPSSFASLSLLAASTSAADDTPNVTINFADGSSVTTTYKAYDWFLGTDTLKQNADVFGTAGVYRYSPSNSLGWDKRAFGMYETDIDLTNIGGIDYSSKLVASLTFAAANTAGSSPITNVFAVSGAARAWATAMSQSYTNNVTVSADSGIDVSGSLNATLGTLSIGSNKLSVTSADTTTNPYSLTFGATTVTGSATIDVAPSSGTGPGTVVLGALSGPGTLTKTNSGTLILAGTSNTLAGNLAVNGGTTQLVPTNTTTPSTLTIAALTFTGTGRFDLTNNVLVTTNTQSTIQSQLNANTLFTSSTAPGTALGYMDLDNNTREVRYTLLGDTNLDGQVNVADLANLAGNFGQASGAFWINGDFDNNGQVNVADLADLAGNFGGTLSLNSAGQSASPASEIAGGSASVPEPATIGLLLTLTTAGLTTRRRRHTRRA
jgi:autotransporter-associated beta strand protein